MFACFALSTVDNVGAACASPRIGMGKANAVAIETMHGLGPGNSSAVRFARVNTFGGAIGWCIHCIHDMSLMIYHHDRYGV
ncbi:hypothetical protein LBMAG07_02460 [Actinomycetes bacterium]|nr:hypothetical protein LBMAG07_02460 [Actinomycetes bacterium]